MTMPQWKFAVLVIGIVLLLLHELRWQWWWWRLDHTSGTGAECSTRNHTLLSNVSNTYQWNDTAYLEYSQGTSDITNPNVQNFVWSSWDVADVYDIEETEETNFSTSSSHDVQGKTTARYSLSNIMSRWGVRRVNPKFPASKYRRSDPRPMPSPLQTETNSWSGHFTARRPIPEQMNEGSANAPEGSLILIIDCVLGCFIGTALVKLSCSVICALWKMKRRVYCRLNCSEQPGEEGEEILDFSENTVDYMCGKNLSDASSTVDIESLILSELPPDLENLLVERLDVRRKGELLYGWQKIGAAFKISKHKRRHLKNEYQKENGSPTSKLLLILGTSKCTTVSDLINVLNSRKVQRPDVASLVRKYIKAAHKSQ